MDSYKEVNGDLIALALKDEFDVITHGCNCFCTMGAGIAPKMAQTFGCDDFDLEASIFRGDIGKLGCIDEEDIRLDSGEKLTVINSYTQYGFGANHAGGQDKPLDYEALTLCLKKINHLYKGKKIGLPQIGCGLAGGDWNVVKNIIQKELKDCFTTVVIFKP